MQEPIKSVAIVGAGTAGLAALKSILDLPKDVRNGWDIIIYEQRANIGGVWLPDNENVCPPKLPQTPLYPDLKTNTPHPTMIYPHLQYNFPVLTPVFPPYQYVQAYLEVYATNHNLRPHIKLHHCVLSTSWVGDALDGHWDVKVKDLETSTIIIKRFDHLVVASGTFQFPLVPQFRGVDEWKSSEHQMRQVAHSIYFRDPEIYAGKNVIVVGNGGSGRDIARLVSKYANMIYHSTKPWTGGPFKTPVPDTVPMPEISHFDSTSIVFLDESKLDDIDAVILATGYELQIPYLTHGGALPITSVKNDGETPYQGRLTNNLVYIRPLFEHVLSLSSEYPLGVLYFLGLTDGTTTASCDTAQALFVANTISDPLLLRTHNGSVVSTEEARKALLSALDRQEEALRHRGYNPYVLGHRFRGRPLVDLDYQEGLITWLKERRVTTGLPEGTFIEQWRREARLHHWKILAAWETIENAGVDERNKWLEGVQTEEQWAELMNRLYEWQVNREETEVLNT